MPRSAKKEDRKKGYVALSSADEDSLYSGKGADAAADAAGGVGLHGLGGNQIPPYGLFSYLTFKFLNPLLNAGYESPLQEEDLYDLPLENTPAHNFKILEKAWALEPQPDEQGAGGAFLWRVVMRMIWKRFFLSGILQMLSTLGRFASPMLLQQMVQLIETGEAGDAWLGYLIAAGMLTASVFQTGFDVHYNYQMNVLGLRVRGGMMGKVFQKATRLSEPAFQRVGVGKIVNLVQIDCMKFSWALWCVHALWAMPIMLIVAISLLCNMLGAAGFVGLIIMVLMMPVNMRIMQGQFKYQKRITERRDERVELLTELLQGMKLIKLLGWEQQMADKLDEKREEELKAVRTKVFLEAGSTIMWVGLPVLVNVATFTVYVLLGNELTATKAFTSLALFEVLQFPLTAFPRIVQAVLELQVSIKRLTHFFELPELEETLILENGTQTDSAPPTMYTKRLSTSGVKNVIDVQHASFRWSKKEAENMKDDEKKYNCFMRNFCGMNKREAEDKWWEDLRNVDYSSIPLTLSDVNFSVPTGALLCIVGRVGTGKTTLLNGLINECPTVSGKVTVSGKMAYCSQLPWIQNMTVRENILCGEAYDQERYAAAVEACDMSDDMRSFADGDETEIGERGINMSGGQKQRVSLCRAVYSDADVYILDDVLSAVDAHVGHHIMHECIVGALKDKTRVLVLHQMQWIHHADYVAVIEDGTVSHFGTYAELKEHGVDFEKYVTKKKDEELPDEDSEEKVDDNVTPKDGMATPGADRGFGRKDNSKGKLTSDEDREVGKVRLGVFLAYIKAVGPLTGTMIITGIVLYQFTRVGSSWWLATWANDTVADETGGRSAFYYLGIYALLCAAQVVTVGMRHGIKAIGQVRAARLLHRRAVWAVFRSPMTWFDMTLTGKIVNRLSSDMQKIDIDLVNTCLFMAFVMSSLVSAMCVMFVNAPFVLSLMPFLLYVYVHAARKYRASVRELVRLESISKSPIYQSFTEALNGLGTIRALRMQDRFCADNEDRLQRNLRVSFLLSASNFWLQVRLSFIGNSFVSGGAAFLAHQNAIGNLSAGIAGLTLTYSSSLIWCLQGLLQAFVGLETSMVSMERVLSYAELTPEAELKVPEDKRLSNWPSKGAIRFEDVSLRYRDNLDPVLKNLDIDIQAGHSIGIVGRTGAGKSSMLVAMFRLVELLEKQQDLSAHKVPTGRILIDGVDIATVGLHTLRRRITIIPQDPTLFSGTLRFNLDPFSEQPESELWRILEMIGLDDFVRKDKDSLDMLLTTGGENLSVGQRQLVCLARALLRKCKIIVLDEATASVDYETDERIQETLRQEVQRHGITMMTIAHRINTILTSDKVIVMDAGRVAEYGNTTELANDKTSTFSTFL